MRHRGLALHVGLLLLLLLLFFSTGTEPRAWHVLKKHLVSEQETNPKAAFFYLPVSEHACAPGPSFLPLLPTRAHLIQR